MNALLVIVMEEAEALRRELTSDQSYHLRDDVRSYLTGKLHTLDAIERFLRRQDRVQP